MVLAGLDGALLDGAVWGLAAAIVLPTLAALVPALPGPLRHALPRALASLACLFAAALGALQLSGAGVAPLEWWPGLPGEPFTLAPDALAAPFLLLFGLVGAGSFAAHAPRGSAHGAAARLALHAAFALSLLAVFASRHALLFLVAWEGMTAASAALVAGDLASARARGAAWVHLAIAHVGAACVALPLVLLSARASSFHYDALASAWAALAPSDSARFAWLFTLGFVIELGLVPAHVRLTRAHPEADGPAAALLSGVMVTTGLYGLLRFVWQMPGAPPELWGQALMALGAASALYGALSAALETDAQRLLAHSTLQNAGLLALAAGLAALLAASGQPALAGLALAAALYHAIGHGLAKSLGCLAVGEATHAAGSRQLDAMGGLARRMPRTAGPALVAALALGALPPLACFAGTWLALQALVLGSSAVAADAAGAGTLRLLAPLAAAALALSGALALAAMVKLYGIGFLGFARSEGAAGAADVSLGRGRLFVVLGALVLAWGLGAPWAVAELGVPVTRLLPGFDPASLRHLGGFALGSPRPLSASASPLVVAAIVLAIAALAWSALRGARAGVAPTRVAPSWSGGVPLASRMQVSAAGLSRPLAAIFEPLLRGRAALAAAGEGAHATHAGPLRHLRSPGVQAVQWSSERLRRLQSASPQVTLGVLLLTLVALLVWAP